MNATLSVADKNPSVLSPGDAVPEFSVTDQDGEPFSDADLRGTWTVLWWYPIADTPG